KLGNVKNPLLVSVRSGAKFSMPGMTDTVLNLGLNPQTLEGLDKLTNDRRFALDAYRRFIQMFGKIVLGIEAEKFEKRLELAKEKAKVKTDPELKPEQLEKLVKEFKDIILKESGKPFPDDPQEQLRAAIEAVFSSWNNKRATDYRNFNKIPHDLGTAVNVQTMVFGNMGNDSGTGVAFTRDPNTGERVLYGDYLANAQGEDVVAGIRTPQPKVIAKGIDASPGAASGKAVFDADRAEEQGKKGDAVILVRIETNPDDVHGMIAAKGVLTARGGKTSHAAVVARGMGKPCVAGAESLRINLEKRVFSVNGSTVKEGDLITINGSTGEVI